MNNFELTAIYLLPYDLVAKRKSSKRSDNTNATITKTASIVASILASSKPSIGKTGVYLR